MKRFLTLLFFLALCYFGLVGCTGGGSDGGEGTTLQTEPVDTPPGAGEGEVPVHNLFSSEPGTTVSMSALTGTVDPVGTNITDDFDGDGLVNSKETTGNVWVADYPHIGATIATPVTMRIEILYNNETSSKELSSEIMAEDTENTKVNSSDVVHRKEVNNRTVQFQDRILTTSSQNLNIGARRIDGFKKGRIAANIKTAGIGSVRTKGTTSLSNSYTDTTDRTFTDWADKPFKNDVDAEGWAQKDNSKSKRAKQLRTEYRTVSDTTKKIKPNSGYVRASLYITNNTVNMPVKLSNILCSFMLENADGRLLPVQSFRLRNDDYSMFELNLYGGKTFGPYVIELANLNSQEIKDAIAKGYNPRIFLVDYRMEHVPDSNYRTALSGSFSGNNLKIIEENAKGRTAGIKLVYPGDRQFFRVTAFDTDGIESRTGSVGATTFSPGVSLEKALNRITYSGVDIQYADIIFDMSGMDPEFSIPRFHIRTIKSINGEEMNLPFPVVDSVPYKTITGNHVDKDGISLGGSSTAYLVKPIGEWTDQEIQDFKVWAVFENGRYYLHTGDVLSTGDVPSYFEYQIPGQTAVRVPMVKGIQSMIWPGDHYDIVCLEFEEQEEETQVFGSNPLETGEALSFNTKWNLDTIEEFPFQPDTGSTYLGEAILGDTIEFTIKLNQTRYLNPDFGTPDTTTEPGKRIYKAFSYDLDRPVVARKFNLDEAVDFEISFGLGGQYKHWTNLVDPINRSPSSIYPLDVSDRNWNYLDQEFTIRIPNPMDLDGVGPDGTVKVFIRPARNNAYRESVWPLPYTEVKQFRGTLLTAANTGATQLEVTDTVGTAHVNDTLYLDGNGYQISTVDAQADKTVLTLATTLQSDKAEGEKVYINLHAPLTEPEIHFELDDNFESDWNLTNQDSTIDSGDAYKPLTVTDQDPDTPANYLGYYNNLMETNWIGAQTYANPYWNQWADSSNIDKLTQKGTDGSQVNNPDNPLNLKNEFMGSAKKISSGNNHENKIENYQYVVMLDNKLLITWSENLGESDGTKGKIFNLIKDKEVNEIKEFDISTRPTSYSAAFPFDDNQKALIATHSLRLELDIIDLSPGNEGNKLVPQISFGHEDFSKISKLQGDFSGVRFTNYNQKALISWDTYDGSYKVKGRFIDLSEGSLGELIGTQHFDIHERPGGVSRGFHDVSLFGSSAFFVWRCMGSELKGRFFDMSNGNEGNALTSEFTLSDTSLSIRPKILSSNNRALVLFADGALFREGDIKLQTIDAESGNLGSLLGSKKTISSSNANNQDNPFFYKFEQRALIVWASSHETVGTYQIMGQIIDLTPGNEGNKIGDEITFLGTKTDYEITPILDGVNNNILITWGNGNLERKAKTIEIDLQNNEVYQGNTFVWNGSRKHYTKRSQIVTNHSPIISFQKGGSLYFQFLNWRIDERNLFKAPLLERDYEVKARIVEELQ